MSAAMRHRVRHQTYCQYGGDVAHSHQLLHLAPRDSATQVCRSRSITLAPQPSTRREDVDAFGNFVTRLEFDLPREHLEVLAEVQVEVSAPKDVVAADSVPWEEVRDALLFTGRPMSEAQLDACRFRMESSYVRIKQVFGDYGADCFAPGSTNIRTSAIEAFAAHRTARIRCDLAGSGRIACLGFGVLSSVRLD